MNRMLLSALLGMVLACIMPAALASGINNYFIIRHFFYSFFYFP